MAFIHWGFCLSFQKSYNNRNIFAKYWKITKNKSLDIDLYRQNWLLASADLRYQNRCDHPGFLFELGLFGVVFNAEFYDGRHWNYEKNKYEE